MSLEQAIQENTAAIRALIAALGTGATSQAAAPVETAPVETAPVETAPVETATAEKPAKEKKQQAPAATPEQKDDAAAVTDEPTSEAAPVSYDDCAASVTKLAKGKGRPAAVALLGEFGLKTLQDAKDKPEVLAQVKVAADAALGD